MKRTIFLGLLIALATGCVNDQKQEPEQVQKIKVTAETVASTPATGGLAYSGTIEASQTIPLNFQTTGTVENVYVEAGDEVKKGQLLATLDDSDLQSIYSSMLSKFNQARDAYDRLKIVHDEGSLPDIKWVEMETNLQQAKSSLDLAKNNLDKCRLTAPVDGTIGRRNIEPGQGSLSLTSAAIELVRIEKVLVRIAVPEKEINSIRKGMEASVTVLAVGGSKYQGNVTNISPVADLIARTYTVKVALGNPGMVLKPGMVCDVNLSTGADHKVLAVPYQAIGRDVQGNKFVYVVSTDRRTVKKQLVGVGQYTGNNVEITGGLKEGDMVVTGGMDKLSDNSLIEL